MKSIVSGELQALYYITHTVNFDALILSGMPRVPVHEWIERTVWEKYVRENTQERMQVWNLLVREIKLIACREEQFLKRLDAYADRLQNIEQEVCIASNAVNLGVEEIEGVKKARRILEVKVLKPSVLCMGNSITSMKEWIKLKKIVQIK